MTNIPNKIAKLTPFIVMDVLERANQLAAEGHSIIHLEVGEPDFDVPKQVKERLNSSLCDGNTHYTHSMGNRDLREEIASFYKRTYKTSIDPDQILVTSGSSPAILLALSTLIEQGDEVIISDPGYACYANFITYAGGVPVKVKVDARDGFQFPIEGVKRAISDRTKAIMINSPMNPTGNLLEVDVLKELAALTIPILSDEIYHGLVYEDTPHSMLEYTDNTFVINGFSKTYAMTGLRLGYLIAPKPYIRSLQILQQNLFICASSIAQDAGIVALNDCDEEVAAMKNTYNERRLYLIERLLSMGFDIPKIPTGAFYVFVRCDHISSDSYKLAFDILEKCHVGVAPGIDFGENGEGFLRFSYANSLENIKEGMDRLEKYLQSIGKSFSAVEEL